MKRKALLLAILFASVVGLASCNNGGGGGSVPPTPPPPGPTVWNLGSLPTRIDVNAANTHACITVMDGLGTEAVASLVGYSFTGTGTQSYKTAVLNYPGIIAGLNAVYCSTDGGASVTYVEEDSDSTRTGNQAGTIKFSKLTATGATVSGFPITVDRGWVKSYGSAVDGTNKLHYLIYAYKEGVIGDVFAEINDSGSLVDYQTIPMNTFTGLALNTDGILLGGNVTGALIAEEWLTSMHTQKWSETYPATPSTTDTSVSGIQTLTPSYLGGMVNAIVGPPTWVIIKWNTATGAHAWTKSYEGSDLEEMTSFFEDSAGNLYGYKKTSKEIFCLSAADGTELWSVPITTGTALDSSYPPVTVITVYGSKVAVGCNDGKILFFNKANGHQL